MTRELIVQMWCDAHAAKHERVRADVTHTVVWDGLARTLDLCQECDAFLAQPLVAILTEVSADVDTPAKGASAPAKGAPGRKPSGTPSDAKRGCALCDYLTKGGPSALSQHLRQRHGFNAGDIVGPTCPVCGSNHPTANGMGNHVSIQHADVGAVSIADALWWAANNGDPHGAVQHARATAATLGVSA